MYGDVYVQLMGDYTLNSLIGQNILLNEVLGVYSFRTFYSYSSKIYVGTHSQ